MMLYLFRTLLAALLLTLSCALASAQSSSSDETAAKQTEARTSADETFELNITERHITQRGFEASTSVEAGEESARGLRLRIGVGVGADSIDVRLHGIRGLVHFRATLAPLLELINSRRANNPSP
jgi:hypothetical protein